MLFSFKQSPADFVVDELLYERESHDDGACWYVRFRKEHKNTMDVISHLCDHTWLNRRQIMLSGLKDKSAITIQRIAIDRADLTTVGGEEHVRKSLLEVVKILDEEYSDQPRGIGRHRANRFRIRLRAREEISPQIKQAIESQIRHIQTHWFPNAFGEQRFGRRNIQRSMDFFNLDHVPDPASHYHLKLKLQAFPSLYFNQLALHRYESGDFLIDGDILVSHDEQGSRQYGVYDDTKKIVKPFDYTQLKDRYENQSSFVPENFLDTIDYTLERIPTGLMMGGRMLLAPEATNARKHEDELLAQAQFLPLREALARAYHLWGHRRPLFVVPEDFSHHREDGDLILWFTLPVGSYATVLLGRLFYTISVETVQRCGWRIEM